MVRLLYFHKTAPFSTIKAESELNYVVQMGSFLWVNFLDCCVYSWNFGPFLSDNFTISSESEF